MHTTKVEAQRLHAICRAKERFQLDIDELTYIALCKLVKTQKAKLLKKQSRRVSIWEVPYKDQTMVAIYDKQRKHIVTFLPGAQLKQSEYWKEPQTIEERKQRLERPTCPKCGGIGRVLHWFSGAEWEDFVCTSCFEQWAEYL